MMLDRVSNSNCFMPDKKKAGDLGKSVISWTNRTFETNQTYHAFKIRYCDLLSIYQLPDVGAQKQLIGSDITEYSSNS